MIREIRDLGLTVLLVTHSMEEAEVLCDRIAVIADGRVIALDTPEGLRRRSADGTAVRLRSDDPRAAEQFAAVDGIAVEALDSGELRLTGGTDLIALVMRRAVEAAIELTDLHTERPSLDEAYLALTSTSGRAGGAGSTDGAGSTAARPIQEDRP